MEQSEEVISGSEPFLALLCILRTLYFMLNTVYVILVIVG